MRVLITGAAGFIGSHLADRLALIGHSSLTSHTIVGVDNLLTGRAENWPTSLHVDPLLVRDITDRRALYEIANQLEPELVIHCAASYSNPDLWHHDVATNINGAINIASVARYHSARVVYFQTVLPPTSSYAISKLAGEQYLRLAGVPLLVVKLANVYGPRGLNGPVAAFAKRLLAGEPCTVTDTSRDFIYVDTVCEHVLEAIEYGREANLTIRSGRETPIREVYELVAAMLNIDGEVEYLPRAESDVPSYHFDPHEQPPLPDVSLRYGIGETVAWYREHGIGQTYTHLRVGA